MSVHSSAGMKSVGLGLSLLPAIFLAVLVIWGLIYRPLFAGLPAIPLQAIFLLSASFAIGQLLLLGFSWDKIQKSIIERISGALPAIFILILIGPLVGSWMISGTIPMLVGWGINLIDLQFLYTISFVVSAIFSVLTGTSWGSAATIAVVLIGVCEAVGANSGIAAGAIIGGCYFGDKLSPLSDTTNVAAIAARADLFDHIRAMLWTTLPSALIAIVVYSLIGFETELESLKNTQPGTVELFRGLQNLFEASLILLSPVLVVLLGAIKKWPTIPILLASMIVAAFLALAFQDFSVVTVMSSVVEGVSQSSLGVEVNQESVASLVERGGLYSMMEAVTIALLVFVFVGSIELLGTMTKLVDNLFGFARGQKASVLAALFASATTNALTSNQSATAFIVGDAFSDRFDQNKIPRRILSRSIEDMGTMIESIIPWHATALFMVATLGVSVGDYWNWQILTLANLAIAPALVLMGVGCAFESKKSEDEFSGS